MPKTKKLNLAKKSSISREVNRFKKRAYDAFISNQIAFEISMNKNYRRSKILSNKKLLKIVHAKLKKRWSPEQISIFLKQNFPHQKPMNVSHETIYFYIYLHSKSHLKKKLIESLRQKKKTRGPARSKESKDIKLKRQFVRHFYFHISRLIFLKAPLYTTVQSALTTIMFPIVLQKFLNLMAVSSC